MTSQQDPPQADLDEARRWLTTLHGGAPGLINIVSTGNWTGQSYTTDDAGIDAAINYIARLDKQKRPGIYARATTLTAAPKPGSRGLAADSLSFPGFWADIDIAGPGHKHEACGDDCRKQHTHAKLPLPPTPDDGQRILDAAGLPEPTMWIQSGGGWYPWHLLDQPVTLTPANRDDIATLSARWQIVIEAGAHRLGWHYGRGVGDLARVLRIPGTINRKANQERRCRVVEASGATYSLDELATLLYSIDLPDPEPAKHQTPPARPRPTHIAPGTIGPYDALGEVCEWRDLLEPYGFRYIRSERDGAELWKYSGSSTESEYSLRAWPHVLVNFSETAPLPVGAGHRLTHGKVFAHWHHGDDHSAAGKDVVLAAAGHPDASPAARALRPAILDHIRQRCGVRPWTPNTPPPANDTPWPDQPSDEQETPAAERPAADADRVSGDVRRAMAAADEQHLWEGVFPQLDHVHDSQWSLPGSDTAPAVLPTFPLHTLPGDTGKFVDAVATYTQTPPEIAAFATIGALSAVVGSHATVTGQWTEETLALYLSTIADSGDGKTRAFKAVNAPIYRLETTLRSAWDRAYKDQADALAIAETAREDLIKKVATANGPNRNKLLADLDSVKETIKELTGPPRPQLLAGDILPEALAKLMHKVGGHIAIVSAEGTFLGNICGRYNNGRPNLEFVLVSWDASEPWRPERISRDAFELDRPSLTLSLSVQPVVIEEAVASKAVTDKGLLNRFLLARPESLVGDRDMKPPAVPAHLAQAWDECVRRAFYAVCPEGRMFDDDGNPLPPVPMQVGEEGEALMLDWRTRHEKRLDPNSGDLNRIKGWMSRAPGNAYRLAALLHLAAGHSPRTVIGPEPMADALTIIDYCVPHAIGILASDDGSTPAAGKPAWVQAACGHILAWIRKKGMSEFTASHVTQGLKGRSWVKEHGAPGVRGVLLALAADGWLATVARCDAAGRRLSDPLFVSHPELVGGRR
ncbi:YfjI family protein [Nonomuraea sp. NPDC050383]|uniref:YfjI family protein n=1 Tax=Nonomuraea sp. NPDC050383 TaxID=3364362 RepID=UPI00378CDC79